VGIAQNYWIDSDPRSIFFIETVWTFEELLFVYFLNNLQNSWTCENFFDGKFQLKFPFLSFFWGQKVS